MADLNRIVAGLRCREVLDDLSEFLDGTLPENRVAQIRAHVAECRVCESFGGEFAQVVSALRQELAASALPPGVSDRLRERLRRERSG